MVEKTLRDRIRQIAWRQTMAVRLQAAAWLLAAGLSLFAALQSYGGVQISAWIFCATGVVGACWSISRLSSITPRKIARQLDELLGSGQQIQSGVQLAFSVTPPNYDADPISRILSKLTLDSAARLVNSVAPARLTSPRMMVMPACAITVAIAMLQVYPELPGPQDSPPARAIARAGRPHPQYPQATLPKKPAFTPVEAVAGSILPRVKDVRCRITAPPDSARPPYEGVIPAGGIAALPGTTIAIWATCSAPIAGGSIRFTPEKTFDANSGMIFASGLERMSVNSSDANQVLGTLVVVTSGTIVVQVEDNMGAMLPDVIQSPVTATEDLPPVVQIVQPTSPILSAPDGTVTLDVVAADDLGITKLELCRSLNGIPAPPLEIPVMPLGATRCPMRIIVKLDEWKLADGDVVKLFIRAGDSNVHGAEEADTPPITVNIVAGTSHPARPSARTMDWLPIILAAI